MSAEHIAALGEGVRVIGRAGIGLDTIDLEAARRRGIAVYHTPDYCVDEVADQTLASILMLQRRMADQQRVARAPGWPDRASLRIHALTVTTVGVVGGGRIGRAVLARLAPFGVRRLVHDPFATEVPAGVEASAKLEELLGAADIVTLHLPLLPETRGLISEARIRSMRPGSFLVNVSRGPLVDTRALAAALHDGHLGGRRDRRLRARTSDPRRSAPRRAEHHPHAAPRLAFHRGRERASGHRRSRPCWPSSTVASPLMVVSRCVRDRRRGRRNSLAGRVALVTGGTAGIGRAIVERLARDGAAVVAAGRDETRGRELSGPLERAGLDVAFVRADVSVAADCRRAVDEVIERHGRLDIVVNNAAMLLVASVEETTDDAWDEVLADEPDGASSCRGPPSRISGLPAADRSSTSPPVHAQATVERLAAYATTKGAVVALSRQMAHDLDARPDPRQCRHRRRRRHAR